MRTRNRSLITTVSLSLALVLGACATEAQAGPNDPGGPMTLLPDTIPGGIDPSDGSPACAVANRTFDDDVRVPKGATCTFTDVTIDGNLIIANGASVTYGGGHIDGNVLVYPSASFEATGTSVNGNVQAERSSQVTLSDASVGGSVQTQSASGLAVVGGSVNGNIQPDDGGSVLVDGVNVNGDVQPFDNRGGVTITDNVIGGNLQCKGNDPAPAGGGNTVHGNAEDQCEDLAD